MTTTELSKKTSEFLVMVTWGKEQWSPKVNVAQEKLLEKVVVKGFRKGKAPRDLALKQLKKAEIYSEAITNALKELAKEASTAITKDLMILDGPSYLVEQVDDEQLKIKFVYPTYPDIKINTYKNLAVKYEEKPLDKSKIDEELKRIQQLKISKEDKNGKIAKGDIAIFDFEGFVDGKSFEGGASKDFELEIGSGQFIPGFEDQMINLAKDEEKEIKVTFPETYHAENLKGKPAIFKVKINQIKTKKTPKLDDEFVKTLAIKNVSTLEELEKYLAEVFALQTKQEARAKFQREVFDKILKDLNFVVPASLIAKEMKVLVEQMKNNLKKQKLTLEQYLKFTGMDQTKLNSQFKATAEKRLKDAFVFAEIARSEKIKVEEQDYDKEYEKLAKVYNTTVEGVKGMINKKQMQIPMTNERVIDKLIAYNKV